MRKGRTSLHQYNVGTPVERIALDVAGPFGKVGAGNKFIPVAMSYFSKWDEAYAMPKQEVMPIADVLVRDMFR